MITMDETKALLHLLVLFPHKSENYLTQKLRKCDHNLSATIEAINNDVPEEANGFSNFFRGVINGFGKLCCGNGEATQEASGRGDLEFVDINISEEFAKNLVDKFADADLILPTGFQPVIQIPVAVGRQLYIAYVQSIFRQQEAYNKIVEDLVKEDEEFARKLQKAENEQLEKVETFEKRSIFLQPQAYDGIAKNNVKKDEEFAKKIQEGKNEQLKKFMFERQSILPQQDDYNKIVKASVKEDEEFAKKRQVEKIELSIKSKIFEKKKAEIPSVHALLDFKATENQWDIKHSGEHKTNIFESHGINQSDVVDNRFFDEDEKDVENVQPASYYRLQASQHFEKRKTFYRKAKQCLKNNDTQLAQFYHQKAKQETEFIDQANKRAAAVLLIENKRNRNKNIIDLHHLYVKEAIEALDEFLDREILSLEDRNLQTKMLTVITGRGKHSRDGVPKIKPAVIERLRERSLK